MPWFERMKCHAWCGPGGYQLILRMSYPLIQTTGLRRPNMAFIPATWWWVDDPHVGMCDKYERIWAQLQPSKRLRRCERIRIRRILVALKEPDRSEQSNVSNRFNMLFCKYSIFASIQLAVFFFLVFWPFSQGQPWQQQSAEDVQIYSKWNFQNKIIYNRNNWEHHDMTVWLRSSIQHTITSVAIHRVCC